MNLQKVNLSELVFAEYNPRKQLTPEDEEYQKIKNSIETFGYVDPIIINSDRTIIGGHQRATVLQDLGWTEADCIIVDMDKDKEKALNVALNKITGSWDFEKLAQVFADLEGKLDLDITGFNSEDIQEMLESLQTEPQDYEDGFNFEEAAEAVEEPETEPGDLYILGSHRLLCGDSTKPEGYNRLMDGQRVDMLLTDPPYNVDYEGSNGLKIQNDSMESSEFRRFLKAAFKNAGNAMKEGAAFYIWHADTERCNFQGACQDTGLMVKQCLIWNKNSLILGRQDYQWKHEPCLYGWKEGAAHYFTDDRTQATVIEDSCRNFKKMKKEELVTLLEEIYSDKVSTTVINEPKPAANTDHPTMKPIKLLARQIKNSTKQGKAVLDIFGGSGSTLIACEQLNRRCYMMELDPKYCDVIVKRWEEFTGQTAKRIAQHEEAS